MKNKVLKKIIGVVLTLSMVISLSACAKKSDEKSPNAPAGKVETKVDKIKKAGKLVIGTSADYPPYEFHKMVNGKDEIVGFDIAIANELAKELGVKLEVKDITFNGLLEALKADKIDLIIAGMNPTPERAKEVDFTKIYYKAVQGIMVRAEDKDKYKSLADLKGKKVGVQMGTVQEELGKAEITGAEIKSLGKITDLVLELKGKKVDALVVELPVATAYADKNKDIMVSGLKFKEDSQDKGSAIAVQKNSPELVEFLNKSLDKLMTSKTIEKFVAEANEMVE
jgi:arginine/lysine/histidine transporter system substrate-binding protein